jgi:hypothetical protein
MLAIEHGSNKISKVNKVSSKRVNLNTSWGKFISSKKVTSMS